MRAPRAPRERDQTQVIASHHAHYASQFARRCHQFSGVPAYKLNLQLCIIIERNVKLEEDTIRAHANAPGEWRAARFEAQTLGYVE